MEPSQITKSIVKQTTEEKEFVAIKKRLALIDIEMASLVKQLHSNTNFATALIRERIVLMTGKFFLHQTQS